MYLRLPIYNMKNTHACVLIHTTHVCEAPWSQDDIEAKIIGEELGSHVAWNKNHTEYYCWQIMKPCFKEKLMECSECDLNVQKYVCTYCDQYQEMKTSVHEWWRYYWRIMNREGEHQEVWRLLEISLSYFSS